VVHGGGGQGIKLLDFSGKVGKAELGKSSYGKRRKIEFLVLFPIMGEAGYAESEASTPNWGGGPLGRVPCGESVCLSYGRRSEVQKKRKVRSEHGLLPVGGNHSKRKTN